MEINQVMGQLHTWARMTYVIGRMTEELLFDSQQWPTFTIFFIVHATNGVPRNFFSWGGSTNSVEDRRQREWGSGGVSPLVRGSTEFANE
jgi:hypothetical protein